MLEGLYNAIRQDAAPVISKIAGRDYSDKRLYPIETPCPNPLHVTNLSSLAEYLNTNVDGLPLNEILCHVESPSEVSIRSKLLGEFYNRATYIVAKLDQIELPFNTWVESEKFNIALQSCFVEDGDRKNVLKYTSEVVAISEMATSDNGTDQAVAVKSGITSKTLKILPNPVKLRPYRTFTEVEQPESAFVFRARQDNGKMYYMLIEADGGAWRSEAMRNIQKYMEQATKVKVIA